MTDLACLNKQVAMQLCQHVSRKLRAQMEPVHVLFGRNTGE